MLHKYLTGFVLLCFNLMIAQNYEANFKADICASFEEEFTNLRNSKLAFNNSFKKVLPNYVSFIDGAIQEEDQNLKYRKGQEARKELKRKFQVEMIFSCEFYYRVKLEERNKVMARGLIDVSLADLPKLNELVAMHPISANYAKRGGTQLFLGNLKAAEADLRKSIDVHPNKDRFSKIKAQTALLALVLEEQGRFGEAKQLYGKVFSESDDLEAAIFQAMVERRSGGKSSNLNFRSSKSSTAQRPSRTKTEDKEKKPAEKSELRSLFKLDGDSKKKDN